ncbi:MAG TPA: DinB family protein [Gemmatimonadaceae bacterium]|jgi:Protein of unknown function (DUF664).
MSTEPEAWLRGPLPGIDPYLMPAAHALAQASVDLERAARGLTLEQLWLRPGGAASIGFHLRHIAGVVDRLFTYSRGESLNDAQRKALTAEGVPGEPPEDVDSLIALAHSTIENALAELGRIPHDAILAPRGVGRAQLPSTVLGLLSHAAEHAQRHTGQLITTSKIVRSTTEWPPSTIA